MNDTDFNGRSVNIVNMYGHQYEPYVFQQNMTGSMIAIVESLIINLSVWIFPVHLLRHSEGEMLSPRSVAEEKLVFHETGGTPEFSWNR